MGWVVYMALGKDQIEDEIMRLKGEIKVLSEKESKLPDESLPSVLIRYLIDEREKTNRSLASLIEKINKLEQKLNSLDEEVDAVEEANPHIHMNTGEIIPLSNLDARIIDFVDSRNMVCADDVKNEMKYKGRNAACTRLNKLCKDGFLTKFQLGHKVYYRVDAGKATKALIISPPQ